MLISCDYTLCHYIIYIFSNNFCPIYFHQKQNHIILWLAKPIVCCIQNKFVPRDLAMQNKKTSIEVMKAVMNTGQTFFVKNKKLLKKFAPSPNVFGSTLSNLLKAESENANTKFNTLTKYQKRIVYACLCCRSLA